MGKAADKKLAKKVDGWREQRRQDEALWALQLQVDPWLPLTALFDELDLPWEVRDRLDNALAFVVAAERADALDSLVIGFRRPERGELEQERRLLVS